MAHLLTKRQFLKFTATLAGAQLIGCGDDDDGTATDMATTRDTGGRTDMTGVDMQTGDDMRIAGDDMGETDVDMGETDPDMGDNDVDMNTAEMCAGNAIEADVSQNHGHTLTIPVADIMAGTEKQYVTGGTTTHCHVVTLTAEDFATLQAGGVGRVYSCNNTEHEYALSCVADVTAGDPAPVCGDSNEGRYRGECTGDTFTP